MRGVPGHPADTDRDTGFQRALAENPGITVVKETVTGWESRPGRSRSPIARRGVGFDGVWTSGIEQYGAESRRSGGNGKATPYREEGHRQGP